MKCRVKDCEKEIHFKRESLCAMHNTRMKRHGTFVLIKAADRPNKYCPKCDTTKESNEFHKNSTAKSGLDAYCRPCRKIYNMGIKEIRRKTQHDFYEDNKARILERCNVRRRTLHGRAIAKKSYDKSKKLYPEKFKARSMLGDAIRAGKVTKPKNCSECGSMPDILHGHHHDYSLPLDVAWVCPSCHASIHKELRSEDAIKKQCAE